MAEFDQPVAISIDVYSRATIKETKTFIVPRGYRSVCPNQKDVDGTLANAENVLEWLEENGTQIQNRTDVYEILEQTSATVSFMY